MNVSEFEFVTPNELCIKDEIEFDYFDETALKDGAATLQEDVYEIKCGAVMVSTHGNFILVCAFCNEEFGDMPSFGSHVHSKHFNDNSETPIETTREERFEEVNFTDDVKYPVESSSNEETYVPDQNFVCETCERRFSSSTALSSHETVHNPQPPDVEKECIKTKFLEARTNSRSPVPQPPNDPNSFCDVCDRQYKSKGALRDHATRHGNSIPLALQNDPTYLICKFCNRKFPEAIERIEHESGHHAGARYECAYCPKTFQNQQQRRTHIYSHTGIKPYFCEVCRKRFVRNGDLIVHLRSHTRERPYNCEHCGQGFTTSSLLCVHRRRHTNTRTHKCDVCEKAFFRNDALKLHKLKHTNFRPFECDVCGNAFKGKASLVAHLKVHSEVKDYVCNICGRKYFQSSSLTNHMKTHGAKDVAK